MTNWFSKLSGQRQQHYNDQTRIESLDVLPFHLENRSGLISPDRLYILRQFRKSVENLLEILRGTLDATSVVLLWSGPATGYLSVYAFSSSHNNLIIDKISVSSGIIGVLKDRHEFFLAPYQRNSPSLPYYSDSSFVGSFYALSLTCSESDQRKTRDYGILSVDRSSSEEWSEDDRRLITSIADQIRQNLLLSRDLLFTDIERRTLQLAFDGVRALNTALDLESVCCAAIQALKLIVNADIFALSLIHNESHEICYITGDTNNPLLNESFLLEDSLVGQVVKYRRVLPEAASSGKRIPTINGSKLFDTYKSVLAIPLLQEDQPVLGVLIIAAQGEDLLSHQYRNMLEMIAAQVAVKIELARSHDQIQQMTITDPLTGIANRRAFQRGFDAMYERALRRTGSFSLIICDIDFFKRVNDVYGHPFGDHVIQQVASQFRDVVRTGDLAARIGGEEFAILLEDTESAGALDVAERLRKKVENLKLFCQGKVVSVTISLGVAAFPQSTDNREKIFNCADQALYSAKNGGRNRSVCWNVLN